jgi:hypothetical protein
MSEPLVIDNVIDGKAPCPDCGEYYTVNANGTLRKHNCPGVITVSSSGSDEKPKTRAKRGSAKKQAPDKVKTLGSALIASGAELAARQVFSRAVPCRPDQIPDAVIDVDNPKEMVGPIIDFLWPQLPPGAQKMITNFAEQEDLIYCCIAWWSWFQGLRKWTELAAKEVAAANKPTVGEVNNVPAQTLTSVSTLGGFEPFSPVSEPYSDAI